MGGQTKKMLKIISDYQSEAVSITPEGAERRVLSHGENLMAVQFNFKAGTTAPMHSHPHEQIGYVVSGEIQLFMAGLEDERLTAGCSYYVSPNVSHGVRVLEPTVLLDCFTPAREDLIE
jgi:quercetin dioxygenase-like cupin family protein